MSKITVEIIPALRDNYIFLLRDDNAGLTAVVDPAEADPVYNVLDRKGWQLTHIFNTHHHWDHTGANLELKKTTGCQVVGYGDDAARIPGIDVHLQDGQKLQWGDNVFEITYIPGHTLGHIMYYNEENKQLFCGDTLFSMGCGRIFEGTYEQTYHSLQKIAEYPADTDIYCTHEYTLANGIFARKIEPGNEDIGERMREAKDLRRQKLPTIPTTVEKELKTNPFLRSDSSEIRKNLGLENASDIEVFTEIRRLKDQG